MGQKKCVGGTERGKRKRTTINQGEVHGRLDSCRRTAIAMVASLAGEIGELRPTEAAVAI